MKTLYLRIYLTVVAVLLLFALAAGWLADRRVTHEREAVQAAWSERATAWAELLESSLPPATAPLERQREALLEWSERLRWPMALDDAAGQRIGTSPLFSRWEFRHGPVEPGRRGMVQLSLSDGRVLWVLRPILMGGERWGPGPLGPGGPPALPVGGGKPLSRAMSPPPPWLPLPWLAAGGTWLVALVVLFVAVAVGAYPVVRRLTRRLESLRSGVEAFGSGAWSQRVDVRGNDEVATVAASFNRAADRIESLVRANRSLLANASHELRSPLARLKMAVAMLPQAAPERAQALQAEIDQDIRELDALVEEVLLASRLDAQAPMVEDCVELLGLVAEEAARHGVDADGEPLSLKGDERLLRRAIRNLLENAQRYGQSERGATTVVVNRVERPGGAWALIRVEDHGPGVPVAERERIFEAFYRLPGHAEMVGGVGLGLSLVQQIARRHGGQVRCEARADAATGSAFVMELPLSGIA